MDLELLKKISVLYLEDDNQIRETFSDTSSKLFKHLYLAKDGLEGLQIYNKEKDNIDIIISDINMPNLNGIEFLSEVRKYDLTIPLIFITAYTETSYLIESIKLGVKQYLPKPLDLRVLLDILSSFSQEKFIQEKLIKQEKDIDNYMYAINQVALITKSSNDGTISYVNDIFCKVSGYEENELIGKNLMYLQDDESRKEIIDEILQDIKEGKTWKGKIKCKGKNETFNFSAESTILPIYEDFGEVVKGNISISFLTTKVDMKNRAFHKNVLKNIQNNKKQEKEYLNKISLLEDRLLGNYNAEEVLKNFKERLEEAEDKHAEFQNQINYYEDKIKKAIEEKNEFLRTTSYKLRELHSEKESISRELKSLKKKFIISDLENKINIEKIQQAARRIDDLCKRIRDLTDLLDFREKEIIKLKKEAEKEPNEGAFS